MMALLCRPGLRLAATLIAAASLSGCASIHLRQAPDQALVRTVGYDNFNKHQQAGPVAARVLPYALLAEQSYEPVAYDSHAAARVDRKCGPDDPGGCRDGAAFARRAATLLGLWRYVWGCDGRDQCGIVSPGPRPAVDGLGVQVWVRNQPVCTEAVIAFRGTVSGSEGDWITNIHWLTRNLPVYDQYDQVRDHIDEFIGQVTRQSCYREGVTRIIAVGHSLGGGLAQLASYASPAVRRVYAFDPSMVTGFYTGGLRNRDTNVIGHRTERVYEHGEILAYGRLILRQFTPPSGCDPRIVTVRFNVLEGATIAQHGLTPFVNGLMREAGANAPERHPVVDWPCGREGAGPS